MRGYLGGKKVVRCDGCYKVIPKYIGKIHGVRGGLHACSTKCVKKAKATKSTGTSCTTEGCGLLVASGEKVCMNKHLQEET